MARHIRVVSRLHPDASFEEKRRDVDKMVKTIRSFYNEPGGLKDQIEKYERYMKPSEKRRLRDKMERNRARARKRDKS